LGRGQVGYIQTSQNGREKYYSVRLVVEWAISPWFVLFPKRTADLLGTQKGTLKNFSAKQGG